MEQNNFIDFYVEENGTRQLFHLAISQVEVSEEGDSFCRVQLLPLLKSEKRIMGIDDSQAKQLSIDFVENLLNGKKLLDIDGNKIELSDILIT